MKNRRQLRHIVVVFCEGDAEANLFGFLKTHYSNHTIQFRGVVNLHGFDSFAAFERKYKKQMRDLDLSSRRRLANVTCLFLFDNDLADSPKIKSFLESQGHLVQQCNPNVEGVMLKLVNKAQVQTVVDKDFRKKCKIAFEAYFGCEAHKMKDSSLEKLFDSEIVRNHLPVLYELFSR